MCPRYGLEEEAQWHRCWRYPEWDSIKAKVLQRRGPDAEAWAAALPPGPVGIFLEIHLSTLCILPLGTAGGASECRH